MKDTIYLQGKSEINHTINEQKRGVLVMCNESITIIRSRYDSMIEGMQTYIDETKKLPKEEQKKRAVNYPRPIEVGASRFGVRCTALRYCCKRASYSHSTGVRFGLFQPYHICRGQAVSNNSLNPSFLIFIAAL